MRDTFSLHEAKAKFSALIRMVREGRRVVITVHGVPVAELRALDRGRPGVQARLEQLEERGVLVPASTPRSDWVPLAKRPGALARFLADRE